MVRGFLVMLVIWVASPALAALSGFYDSAEKIGVILSDAGVGDALHQAPILSITAKGAAKGAEIWVVKSQDCTLKVALTPKLPEGGAVGKTTYDLRIVKPCP